ncbi:hypothetical protein E5Q_03158 [Mixia osmundae IAM 14324]|uniref:Endonuclease/exonuclease/phosphatase domain-containing protein n=1 Tax=Mixia osmundae (strain CBS 9802 / IAM 14324 / JCM 22182 / KY 12970) TaxID=764103 RepID=G7E0Y0_MIXOS|nr:hypothetical protein E5Q_03158 [Mixia osmundae IAM 14324]
MDASLRILTLNIWGLKFVSKDRQARVRAIGDILAASGPSTSGSNDSRSSTGSAKSTDALQSVSARSSGYDLVCLQEVWVRADGEHLKLRARESGLIYSRFFYSGALGSGLLMLSRHPIVESNINPYRLNGQPLHVIQGDWFVGKAAGSIVVDVPGVGLVEVFNTHLHAPGGEGPDEWRRAHRLSQAYELGKLADAASLKGRHAVVCGDLNSRPESLVIRMLQERGNLQDAWAQSRPSSHASSAPRQMTPQSALQYDGVTCDSPICSYTVGKHISDDARQSGGKRLDYVLFSSHPSATRRLEARSCKVVCTELTPGYSFSLSDHFGVEAVLSLGAPSDQASTSGGPTQLEHQEQPRITTGRLSSESLNTGLGALQQHMRHASVTAQFHLRLFAASIVFVPVLAIAASFQPLKYLNWIFTLLGVATGFMGTTMLYVGFVGARWEMGSLRNVMDEMEAEAARARTSGHFRRT